MRSQYDNEFNRRARSAWDLDALKIKIFEKSRNGVKKKNSKIYFGNISSWPGMTLIVTFPRMNNHEWSWIHILSIDRVQLCIISYILLFIWINTFRGSILEKHNQTDTRPVTTNDSLAIKPYQLQYFHEFSRKTSIISILKWVPLIWKPLSV